MKTSASPSSPSRTVGFPVGSYDGEQRANSLRSRTLEGCEGPIDRIAVLQMIRGPECNRESLTLPSGSMWSDDPIPWVKSPAHAGRKVDFTGLTRGSGTVVGFFGSVPRVGCSENSKRKKGTHRNYWVMKCLCGGYQLINEETLRKPAGNPWMCQRCSCIRDIRRGFGSYKAEYDARRQAETKTEELSRS